MIVKSSLKFKTLRDGKLVSLKAKVLKDGHLEPLNVNTFKDYTPPEPVPLWTAIPTKLSLNGVVHEGRAFEVPELHRVIHTVELNGLNPDTIYDFYLPEQPTTVYVTFKGDPRTNMVVHWQTNLPFLNEVKEPNPMYSYKFKTLPATLPVTMISGGDIFMTGHAAKMRAVFDTIANRKPDIFVICGDIAYANNDWSRRSQWHIWWDEWMLRVDKSEPITPMVVGIGNHEIGNGEEYTGYFGSRFDFENKVLGENTWFAAQFAFPENGSHGVIDIGDDISLIMTDTEHASPEVDGTDDQSIWLQNVLDERKTVKHVIPFTHTPSYPANRSYNIPPSRRIRNNWTPIFETHEGIKVVFEHHDHVYKRTVPIKHVGGEPVEHPDGIIYLGDGAMGVPIRDGWNPNTTWYLEESKAAIYVQAQSGEPDPMDGQPGYDTTVDEAWHMYETVFENDKRTINTINVLGDGQGTLYHTIVQEVDHV